MFPTIVMIVLVSQNYLTINGEMIIEYPKSEQYRQHLFLTFEKYLEPSKVNFCMDCEEFIHLIPRSVALVMISRKDKIINWPAYNKVDSYILDLTRETKERLEFLERTPGWNPRAKFFIVYRKKARSYLLKVLFSKYIVNVAIFSNTDNTTLTIRTYDPFKNGELRPKILKTTIIATIKETNREIDLGSDLFPNKYPQRWNDITVNVLPVNVAPYMMIFSGQLVGLDFRILISVGRRMGIKFNFSSNDMLHYWGEKDNDGKYSFAFGALQAQKFDISVGAFHVGYPECVDFDMAYPVMEDYLVMAVPTAPVKERWKCIVDVFKVI
ncbi:uncharacterized protein LOC108735666 [Agrilus planipennis]|uniref:Uncharacterized protein LOC108735666 n=1 Tax=Agrilus planipennis TaxID=224129 RepID=A0A1W4WRW4_AGRPL|nr:uncharacterized protein LOC108735666 [Agrilus planipennis]